jgi:hypothetical protein
MKLQSRLAVLAVAASGCFAGAGAASAALNATLAVGTGSPGLPAVSIRAAYALSDPAVGRVQFYVPAGYAVNTSAPGGATVGTATAGVYVTDVVGEETMTGNVTVATAAPAEGQKVPNCDPVAHAATWVVNVTGTGHQWSIPLYVDKTTGSEAQLGATKLVVCVPPPEGQSDLVRALNGNRLLSLQLNLTRLTNPSAAGEVRWRALQTPFAAKNAPGLDQAGSVETQSLVSLPQRLTLKARGATLSGTLTAGGKPLGSTLVQLEVSKTKARLSPYRRVRTNAAGSFSARVTAKGVRYFRANVTTGTTSLGASACTPSFGASVPCVGAWRGGTHLLTGLVRVKR